MSPTASPAELANVQIDLGDRSYDIRIGAGLIESAGDALQDVVRRRPAFVVTDETVADLHLPRLTDALGAADFETVSIVLAPGEATKRFEVLEALCSEVLDHRPERGSALIAFGGGVIGDLTGVAASLILRGIDFIQIPTTLLAQVDSSVGGKTGINTRHGKNLVGSFYQPRRVLADVGVLDTLPPRELLAGYAEVVKYGLIGDAPFYDWLEQNGTALIDGDMAARRHAVEVSCRAKARVVADDERETGQRALLNFGHTFGHALEAETGFGDRLLHGEAVAIGMLLAMDLSARMGLCPESDVRRTRDHFEAIGLPTEARGYLGNASSTDALIAHMRQDKKVSDGKLTFILSRGIGDAFISREVPEDALRETLLEAVPA